MPEPRDKDARRFYRAARERWDDAEFLADADRTTGAVYMAGYCVECVLKALIVAQAPRKSRAAVLARSAGTWRMISTGFVASTAPSAGPTSPPSAPERSP